MPASSDVNAGDDATAVQYNDLRADVVNVVTGHGHTGVSEDGKLIGLDGLAQEVKDTLGSPKSIQTFAVAFTVTTPSSGGKARFETITNQAITAVDLAKSYIVSQGFEIASVAGANADEHQVGLEFTSTTNVRITANHQETPVTPSKAYPYTVYFTVVEWP